MASNHNDFVDAEAEPEPEVQRKPQVQSRKAFGFSPLIVMASLQRLIWRQRLYKRLRLPPIRVSPNIFFPFPGTVPSLVSSPNSVSGNRGSNPLLELVTFAGGLN
eukprot:6488498-Amphidinium_carterae.2